MKITKRNPRALNSPNLLENDHLCCESKQSSGNGYYFHGTILATINHGSRDRNSLIFTEDDYLCSESKQ